MGWDFFLSEGLEHPTVLTVWLNEFSKYSSFSHHILTQEKDKFIFGDP
jgi:hypothetical protein